MMEHLGYQVGIVVCDDVPFELKCICHLVTDIKGLRNEAKTGDALEGLESRAMVDEIANVFFH